MTTDLPQVQTAEANSEITAECHSALRPTLGRLDAIFQARKQLSARPVSARTLDTRTMSLPQLMRICREESESAERRDVAAEELRRRLRARMRGKISESMTHATSQTLEDLTQTAMLRLLSSKWTALETDVTERGYGLLDTICRSVVQDSLRKTYGRGDSSADAHRTRRRPMVALDDPVYADEEGVLQRDKIPDSGPGIWEQMSGQMQSDALRSLLRKTLPESEYAVIWLNFFEGMTLKEAADQLNITHEAARTRCSRALKRLRGQHNAFANLCLA